MKTIRLLYPDYVSGGLTEYYFGANLMQWILPANDRQKLIKVDIAPPSDKEKRCKTVSSRKMRCFMAYVMPRQS